MTERTGKLGLWSGVGLVVANMIGVGVLTSTGFMSGFSPNQILLAWVIGGVMAMAGARAYAAIAAAVPRSGGEYTYLSTLIHPSLGYLAGWTSLLVGFAAPVAADAYAAGLFSATLVDLPPRVVAALLIVAVTLFHALNLRLSKTTQNLLAVVKIVLLVGFVVIGALFGRRSIPVEGGAAFHLKPYMISLFFIAYAYSGWNAAIYNAGDFAQPRRDVPRAMLLGTAIVMLLYLAVNLVFVANLSSASLSSWAGVQASDPSRGTLAHVMAIDLVGEAGASIVSIGVILSLFSAMSAMTMIGPRVYAQMARDGYLPRRLIGTEGKPPLLSAIVQGGLALLLLGTHQFDSLMKNVGVILTLTSALTVLSLVKVQLSRRIGEKPGIAALLSGVVYVGGSTWMLWFGITGQMSTKVWLIVIVSIAAVAYAATRYFGGRAMPVVVDDDAPRKAA